MATRARRKGPHISSEIVVRPVSELSPYAKNARTHSDRQIDQIVDSIKEFGFTNPVLVKGDEIVAGHGRVMAAERMGLPEVPTIDLQYMTKKQARAYVIADNKLAENAGWDLDLLSEEVTGLLEDGFDVGLLGLSTAEINNLVAVTGQEKENIVPDVVETDIVLGDMFQLGEHRIRCGDATIADDVMALLGDVKPHLMVTDPPYGVDYDPTWRGEAGVNQSRDKMGAVANDDRADWREAWALFPGNVAYVWHAGIHSHTVAESLTACGFKLRAQIIWSKDRFALSRGDYHWQHEPCWYAVKDKGMWAGDRSQSTVWNIPARDDHGHGHGTQKPVECMRRPVVNNSSIGQAIYEPFSGSGTTIIACEQTQRACYAMELDPVYVETAIQRWEMFTNQKRVKLP